METQDMDLSEHQCQCQSRKRTSMQANITDMKSKLQTDIDIDTLWKICTHEYVLLIHIQNNKSCGWKVPTPESALLDRQLG